MVTLSGTVPASMLVPLFPIDGFLTLDTVGAGTGRLLKTRSVATEAEGNNLEHAGHAKHARGPRRRRGSQARARPRRPPRRRPAGPRPRAAAPLPVPPRAQPSA